MSLLGAYTAASPVASFNLSSSSQVTPTICVPCPACSIFFFGLRPKWVNWSNVCRCFWVSLSGYVSLAFLVRLRRKTIGPGPFHCQPSSRSGPSGVSAGPAVESGACRRQMSCSASNESLLLTLRPWFGLAGRFGERVARASASGNVFGKDAALDQVGPQNSVCCRSGFPA